MTGYEEIVLKKKKKSYRFVKYANSEQGEEVLISGFAGKFPESNNVDELRDNLFNRKDCIIDEKCRWKLDTDAGINPKDIPGTRTGVLVSICFSNTEATLN
ncbi:fatty acid synthase-like [Vespula maculifrons]|uniref:Fatty acid synthase-like n=1 Tax=Vespula maculifrons TaxID=7453 RepID=A0ABD2CT40_VESMC